VPDVSGHSPDGVREEHELRHACNAKAAALVLGGLAALLAIGGFGLGVYLPNLHNGLIAAAFTAVGVFALRRRPDNREAWLFAVTGVAHAVMFFGRQYGLYAGETVTITVDGRPVAIIQPVGRRPRWLGRDEFVRRLGSRRADATLRADLAELATSWANRSATWKPSRSGSWMSSSTTWGWSRSAAASADAASSASPTTVNPSVSSKDRASIRKRAWVVDDQHGERHHQIVAWYVRRPHRGQPLG
jgi:antitoxin (DNA-binding transcriptional repressor) of toxin-antitoxin stability system